MEEKTVLRDYERKDAPFLQDIIRKTWQYDRFCSPGTAKSCHAFIWQGVWRIRLL